MKQLACEMCGGTDLIKQDGVFICQNCGAKYSVEEAKNLMIEGTVRVDNTHMISNYLEMAKNAEIAGNNEEAENYANKIIEINPNCADAWFIKGKTAGWKTTGRDNRFSESTVAWINAINCIEDDRKDEFISKISIESAKIGIAIIQMQRMRPTIITAYNVPVPVFALFSIKPCNVMPSMLYSTMPVVNRETMPTIQPIAPIMQQIATILLRIFPILDNF